MEDQLEYLAISDPYTLYFDQAMKEPNHKEFLITAAKEVNSNYEPEHLEASPTFWRPKGTTHPEFCVGHEYK